MQLILRNWCELTRSMRAVVTDAKIGHQVRMMGLLAMMTIACSGADDASGSTVFEELGYAADPAAEEDDSHQAEHDAQSAERNDRVTACMRSKGFPVFDDTLQEPIINFQGLTSGTVEFAQRFGYGFFPRFDELIVTHPAAKSDEFDFYFDQLTEGDQLDYNVALHNPDDGCVVEAAEIFDEAANVRQAVASELFPAYLQLTERVNADKVLADYDSAWAQCMSDVGFAYESSPKARQQFETEFFTFWDSASFLTSELSAAELRALPDDERLALYSAGPKVDEPLKAAMTQEEIEAASADAECQSELGSRSVIYFEVLADYEFEFQTEHADQLARLEQ